MINEAKEGLEDWLHYNYAMREQEEDLQLQEESWKEEELIRKAQEEAEEQHKQSEMDACMNKEQQVPEDQQAAKAAMENAKEQECVHGAQKYIEISSDSSSSLSSDDSLEELSDESSDSSSRQKPTKPVTSSNKSSTFLAKRKSDN